MLAVLCYGHVEAQVDIESIRRDGKAGLTGSIELDLTVRSGNVDLFEVGPGILLSYVDSVYAILLVASGDVGWEGNERFSNEALGHLRYVHRISHRVYAESFIQANYDKSRRLNYRNLVGGGIRLNLVSTAGASLSLGSSYLFEHEQNGVPAGGRHPGATSVNRWNSYVGARLKLSQNAVASGTLYSQPNMSRFSDRRFLMEAKLTASVTDAVSLHTTVFFRHDSDPVDTIARSDFRLSTGVSVGW